MDSVILYCWNNSNNNKTRNNATSKQRAQNTVPASRRGLTGLLNKLNKRFGTRPEDVRRQIAIVNDYRSKPHKIGFWR